MKEDTGIVKSVLKALAALEFVVEESMTRPGVGLSEIARALEIQPTTARNILKTMEQAGYIARTGDRLYTGGGKCRGMSRAALVSGRLLQVIKPELAHLAHDSGESLVVTTLVNGRRKVLLRQQGGASIVVDTRNAEQEQRGYALVTTRIMLAFAAASEVDLFVARNGLPAGEWGRIHTREELNAALGELRRAGYAEANVPAESFYAAAFPLLDAAGMMVGALGVYLPLFRGSPEVKMELFSRIGEMLRHVRDRL